MKKALIVLIRFYQRHISPGTPPCCRFIPTCSQYALEAIEKYGALRGGLMAIWRILRCNPFGKGGYDPVDKKDLERYKREFLHQPAEAHSHSTVINEYK